MATVNQQIDALLKRGKNPAKKSAQWVVHLRNFSTKKTKTVNMSGGLSEPEAVRNAVLKAGAYWQATKIERSTLDNPARKSRKVTLVAANPCSSRNLAAPRKKPRENWPRFVVEEQEGVGPWMPRASFRIVEDAEMLARAIHKAQPSIAVRVIDTKS